MPIHFRWASRLTPGSGADWRTHIRHRGRRLPGSRHWSEGCRTGESHRRGPDRIWGLRGVAPNGHLPCIWGIRGDKSSTIASEELNDSVLSKDPEGGGENCEGDVETESLSDINDVDWYLHNEEETQCKKIIWEEMNREYLQEQAAKEALAARGVVQEAKKKRRRNEDTKSSKPAETPAEVTYNMLKRKGLGSKVSEGALGELYKTLDEDGSINEKGEMDFEAQYGLNNADGETFDHGYYNYDGYEDDGAGA